MSDTKPSLSKLSPQDKAERTTQAANSIMEDERRASDAKVARLKALRLANSAQARPEAPKPAVKPRAQAKAAALRKLALHDPIVPAGKPKRS